MKLPVVIRLFSPAPAALPVLLSGCCWPRATHSWMITAPTPTPVATTTQQHLLLSTTTTTRTTLQLEQQQSPLSQGISTWLVAAAPPPSKQDIQLLRNAFAEFYGVNRDLDKSLDLLNQVVDKWQNQPADEKAGLYRVRADCHMLLSNAKQAYDDYNTATKLLELPESLKNADPAELPASLLGRARAGKVVALLDSNDRSYAKQAAEDYEKYLKLSSREEWDTDQELLEDGATRNPFAAWEWGDALFVNRDYGNAVRAHALASSAFDEIGDKARSVMSLIDAGIDLANDSASPSSSKGSGADTTKKAVELLQRGIAKTKGIEGRDVMLLQRVVSKEGEGRMALASLLWTDGQRAQAEQVLGDACLRLDQLQAQIAESAKKSGAKKQQATATALESNTVSSLKFSIDDDERNVGVISCSSFRNAKFVANKLGWSDSLQQKVTKLETLR